MTDTRRYSPRWTALAAAVFVADIFLHLPISDFCDGLAKRFGFSQYDHVARVGFLVLGLCFAAGVWLWARRDRVAIGVAATLLIAIAALARKYLCVAGIEDIHYPQYAILSFLLARGLPQIDLAWLGATALGVVDEGYQFLALPRGRPTYFDWNDVVLNGIGAAAGIAIVLALTRFRVWRVSSGLVAGISAIVTCAIAFVLAPPALSPFYTYSPSGLRFHKLEASEAVIVLALLGWGVRWLGTKTAEPIVANTA
jgi:hypothetical protein